MTRKMERQQCPCVDGTSLDAAILKQTDYNPPQGSVNSQVTLILYKDIDFMIVFNF